MKKISEIEFQINDVSNFKNTFKEFRFDVQSNFTSPDEYIEHLKSNVREKLKAEVSQLKTVKYKLIVLFDF